MPRTSAPAQPGGMPERSEEHESAEGEAASHPSPYRQQDARRLSDAGNVGSQPANGGSGGSAAPSQSRALAAPGAGAPPLASPAGRPSQAAGTTSTSLPSSDPSALFSAGREASARTAGAPSDAAQRQPALGRDVAQRSTERQQARAPGSVSTVMSLAFAETAAAAAAQEPQSPPRTHHQAEMPRRSTQHGHGESSSQDSSTGALLTCAAPSHASVGAGPLVPASSLCGTNLTRPPSACSCRVAHPADPARQGGRLRVHRHRKGCHWRRYRCATGGAASARGALLATCGVARVDVLAVAPAACAPPPQLPLP